MLLALPVIVMARFVVVAALLLLCGQAVSGNDAEANPIRRVVSLLQEMQAEIEKDGEKEQELFDKYMCYCETTSTEMTQAGEEAKTQIEEMSAKLEEAKSQKTQLEQELMQHNSDRDSAKQDLAKATSIRGKEAAEYADTLKSSEANIAALASAIPAIEKGIGGASLAQLPQVSYIAKLVEASPTVTNLDRENVVAFLTGKSSSDDYAPQSGQIVGILKQMKDQMETSLADAKADEASSLKGFAELKAAKSKEVQAASDAIESKGKRAGELAVTVSESSGALDDSQAELADTTKYLATLKDMCKEKSSEWSARKVMRSQEVSAISQAISVLNDDDALDVFKKSIPSAAMVETGKKGKKAKKTGFLQGSDAAGVYEKPANKKAAMLQKAITIVTGAASIYKSNSLDLLSLNLKSALKVAQKQEPPADEHMKPGEEGGFSTVTGILDNMVKLLQEEQASDDKKKDWCDAEFASAEDERDTTQGKVDDTDAFMQEVSDEISTLSDDVKTLEMEIKQLDASVTLAGINRKKEHGQYTETITLNEAAVQLIEKAKNRLNKFYNPALYKEAPKEELSRQDRIVSNMGASFVEIHSHHMKVAPPAAPETWGEYKPAGGKSGGVIALMDMLAQDLKNDMAQAKHDEEMAQKEYDDLMVESKETRAQDAKSIVDKNNAKANLEAKLTETKEQQGITVEELGTVHEYIAELHSSCDFIVNNMDLRREARQNEMESLRNAKAVLLGAKTL